MAVIVKYVVERDGVEKMIFTSKKEADAYDKMLDIADQIAIFLKHSKTELSDAQAEGLGFFIANNKSCINNLFKGLPFDNNELIDEVNNDG
ncbi:YebG family protein [Celerinatantimonas sp. YJH-8]|uniref:YebG family protein n=1 Tax=Celerinatantimonas sp. YJH-8 TaxID=3228714 RepID=UPI0038BE57C6